MYIKIRGNMKYLFAMMDGNLPKTGLYQSARDAMSKEITRLDTEISFTYNEIIIAELQSLDKSIITLDAGVQTLNQSSQSQLRMTAKLEKFSDKLDGLTTALLVVTLIVFGADSFFYQVLERPRIRSDYCFLLV